ncbi:metallophosphoesterase [Methylovulum psychrotolerans]|uniref:metallophosphoesterase family protein n=1 Tax=Methylovulum psychrotolerans TaxID=1704499 RepID=UPI001BFF9DE1|nr:metallophosphoesterase [Methylovulum psychrotolerans]MBT9099745.1 metallophosphoesterase [Methylovulum psychrotolerans]
MSNTIDRRHFLQLTSVGVGVAFASGLGFDVFAAGPTLTDTFGEDFYFVQLSDTHWGFKGSDKNPDAAGTLQKAVAAVNALEPPPDFVVFTGDLTHTTDDAQERRRRMAEFKAIVGGLKVKDIRFIPGEHDASLDKGLAYQEFFGPLQYRFQHKGIHFIALDNVSDPAAQLGIEQLAWLKAELAQLPPDAPIVIFTHRPLFALFAAWDWTTRDGQAALDLLMPYQNVVVFYGHIHQTHHHNTGHIQHHAATSLIFPLPAPGSVPKRAPIPWNSAKPYDGLGFRQIEAYPWHNYRLQEHPLAVTVAL